MSTRQGKKGPLIILRKFSTIPEIMKTEDENVFVSCPFGLEDDKTAFAFYNPNPSEALFPKDAILYATRRRDPVSGDLVLFELRNALPIVRTLCKVIDHSFLVLATRQTDSVPEFVLEEIDFSEVSACSVVMIVSRL